METLLLVALLTAVAYVAACAFWPFAAHRRCGGTGKLRSPSGKAWRRCPGCSGTGSRIRVGRKVYEILSGGETDKSD